MSKINVVEFQPKDEIERAPKFSDEALALQFAARHVDELRYVAAWGKWLSWNGQQWCFDETLEACAVEVLSDFHGRG